MTLFIVFLLSYIACALTDVPVPPVQPTYQYDADDEKIINETFAKYGPPEDYMKLGLPGSEFSPLDPDKENSLITNNTVISEKPGTYILKTRTVTRYFSYNGRFENATLETGNTGEIPIVKGQFGEHFQPKNRVYYLRTIGYVLDENGYRQFLIELRRINIKKAIFESDGPGAPSGSKITISSAVLGTLIGGNSLG